jgi:hypothetical protein
MRLEFKVLEDCSLKATESDLVYSICEYKDIFIATINDEELASGNLSHCINCCKTHNKDYHKLNFEMFQDGLLEARKSNIVYSIVYLNSYLGYKNIFIVTVNGADITFGDIYKCLDCCNKHYYESVSE